MIANSCRYNICRAQFKESAYLFVFCSCIVHCLPFCVLVSSTWPTFFVYQCQVHCLPFCVLVSSTLPTFFVYQCQVHCLPFLGIGVKYTAYLFAYWYQVHCLPFLDIGVKYTAYIFASCVKHAAYFTLLTLLSWRRFDQNFPGDFYEFS